MIRDQYGWKSGRSVVPAPKPAPKATPKAKARKKKAPKR